MHNHGVEQALDWDADAICFLDPDQVHPEDMLEVLVRHLDDGCDVVGAMVPLRSYLPWNGMKPFQPMAWVKDGDSPLERIREEDGYLQNVHSVGTGVLLVKSSLLERMSRPWFHEHIDKDSFNRFGGHDTRFVGRLRDELGVKIWVDTTIKVEHLMIFPIDETFSERFPDYPQADVTEVGGWNANRDQKDGFGGWSIDRACYEKIRQIVPDGGTILELGSGAVTEKLAKHYTIYSIEEDEKRVNGTPIIFAPIRDGWYDVEAIKAGLPDSYDLILIDGPVANENATRMGFWEHRDLFNLDVPLVFDDVNRPEDDLAMQMIARLTHRTPEIHRGSSKDFGVLL
jgi:hypothetical protein